MVAMERPQMQAILGYLLFILHARRRFGDGLLLAVEPKDEKASELDEFDMGAPSRAFREDE
eukprot:3082046-Amphidinium_carterae.1